VCNDKTVNTDPGVCLAASVSIIDPASVVKTAAPPPDTTKQTPAAPYALGTTSPVSVVVNYPGGITSAASNPTCSVTVMDKELPRVAAINICLYPIGKGNNYEKSAHCFAAPELVTNADNCPNASPHVTSCRLIGPALAKHLKDKVVHAQSNRTRNRKIRAVVRGTDSSSNVLKVEPTGTINKD
jgi:hypothetical protein